MINHPLGGAEQREQAKKWLGGVVLAIVLAAYGFTVLSAGHATIRTRSGFLTRSVIELDGFDARLYGIALIVAAAALHFGLFWRNDSRYWGYGEIGLAITGAICVVLVFWLLARQFMNFI